MDYCKTSQRSSKILINKCIINWDSVYDFIWTKCTLILWLQCLSHGGESARNPATTPETFQRRRRGSWMATPGEEGNRVSGWDGGWTATTREMPETKRKRQHGGWGRQDRRDERRDYVEGASTREKERCSGRGD